MITLNSLEIHSMTRYHFSLAILITLVSGCTTNTGERNIHNLDLASGNYECVSMHTSMGTIELALDKIRAPLSVGNFLNYTQTGFYDNTIFHRVIDGFMIQGGGFDQALRQKKTNAPITNEANNGLLNIRGSIAMARTADPNSATAQFFINTVDNKFLDYRDETVSGWGYAVFGQVIDGMNVVDAIGKVQTGASGPFPQDVPQKTIMITKLERIGCK